MAKFANGDIVLILKDHESDPGNTPPNATLWTLKTIITWNKGISFALGDITNQGGLFFICTASHTSSNDNIPPNDLFWQKLDNWANSVSYPLGITVIFSDIAYECRSPHTSIYGPDENGNVDISDKWVVIEHSEQVPQSIRIVLNAKEGRFMTREPIIEKFDRIYYQYTDNLGRVTKDVFHVRHKKRQRRLARGKTLELICPHQSENLWKQTISFPGRKISGNNALENIVTQLNANIGANDPTVELPSTFDTATKTGSRLSTETANDYIFESIKTGKAFDKIKDIEQQPVEGGGTFEAMYIRFVSKYDNSTNTNLNTVQIQAFEQGFTQNGSNFNNTPKVTLLYNTIESGSRPTVQDLDTNEDPPKATNIIALGHKKSGTYPVEFMKFSGAKDVFNSARIWAEGLNYKKGNLVTENELTYEARINNTSTALNAPSVDTVTTWIQRTFTKPLQWEPGTFYNIDVVIRNNDIAYKSLVTHTSTANDEPPNDLFWIRVFFPPTVDYSPQTKDRAQDWINFMAGAKFADQNDRNTAVVDHNCIIFDDKHPRNPVRILGTSPNAIPSEHLVGGNIPNGYKMLVVSTNFQVNPPTATDSGTGEFSGNDPNGISFAGNIAEYRDPDEDGTGTWFVFKTTGNDEEILDWNENDSWTKNPCVGTLAFLDQESVCQLGTRSSSLWIKGSYRIINILGFDRIQFINNRRFDCVHEVAFDITAGRVKVENTTIMQDDVDKTSAVSFQFEPPANASLEDRRYFGGVNFWSLDPLTSNNIPYGGTAPVVGDKIKLSIFDFYNMFKTHENKEEWFGPQVEDYYPIQAYDYTENLKVTIDAIFQQFDLQGDYTMEMWFADARHNVVTIEYDHSRNDVSLDQDNSLSKMEPYFAVPGISVIFAAPEPEIINVFQPREWQFGGILTKDSYDDQGRYKAKNSRFNGKTSIQLILDAWRMVKPLVATNVDEPTAKPVRNIETTRQNYEGIISYAQLKNLVLGLSKLLGFERKEILHKTKAKNDIQFGDPVYTTDPQSFSEDDDSINNTILTVADKIITIHSKPKKGPGGSTRMVHLVTRFFP